MELIINSRRLLWITQVIDKKKISKHHAAAEHHSNAAKHHEAGRHQEGNPHAHIAHGYHTNAKREATEASQHAAANQIVKNNL